MPLGFIATAIGIASSVASHKAGDKLSSAQQAANLAQRRINRLKNFQVKREFIRRFREDQALALVSGVASGVGLGSSATQSALASQKTQAAVSSTEFNLMNKYGGEMTNAMNAQSRYQARAQTWGAVSSLASQFISFPTKAADTVDPRRLPGDNSGRVTSMPSIFNVPGN